LSEIATDVITLETSGVHDSVTRDAAQGTRNATATRAPSSIEVYRQDFSIQKAGPAWLNELRAIAIERFETLGFPSTKNEDWHFTSVAPIAERSFRLAVAVGDSTAAERADRRESSRRRSDSVNALGVKSADVASFSLGQSDWHKLVFINGAFDRTLSSIDGLDGNVRVESLARAIEDGAEAVERHLGRIATFDQHAFTALSTAFAADGAFIELANDAVVDKPIHLVFVSGGEGVSHPRNLIVAGRHSRATIIETYVSLRESAYFTNAVTEISIGDGAHIDHYKLQRESESAYHVGTVQAREARNGVFHSFSFAVGGALARTNIYTSLDGDAAARQQFYFGREGSRVLFLRRDAH
jgi:Fe-S cluster assembly protein SufD